MRSLKKLLRGALGGALIAFMPATTAMGELVEADIDIAYPSGGSGAPMVASAGGTAMVEIAPAAAAPSGGIVDDPGSASTPVATLTFAGVLQTSVPTEGFLYKPPDTHMAVGTGAGLAGRIVEVTNTGVQIFSKSGLLITSAVDLDIFLTGLGATGLSGTGVANLCFDPKVIFDQDSNRFFIVTLDGKSSPNPSGRSNVHISTSKTATPSTLTSADWTNEVASALTNIGGTETWFDYPGIGADATRLVVTGNMFSVLGAFIGTKIRVYLKSSLTDNGSPAGETFNDINISESAVGGVFTIQPAHTFGTTLNGDFYCINRFGPTAYRTWQITGAGGAASLASSSPTITGWTAGAQIALGAPQINGGLNATQQTIDTLSSRLMNAYYRDDSIWTCMSADTDSDGQTEVVWFEIDPNSGNGTTAGVGTTPVVIQSGSIDGSTAGSWTFMPSIAVNTNGDAAICYSESNSSKAVDMRVVTRTSGETAGTFQSPVVIATGAGEYDDFSATEPERWGDYSAAVVDPDDDTTFWVANEVNQTAVTASGDDGRWGTRIAQLGTVVPVELSTFEID